MINNLFDFKKTFAESIETQKKVLDGFETLLNVGETEAGFSPKTEIYAEDKMKVYRYKPVSRSINKIPTLLIYALVNRETMLDLQKDRSFIQKLLEDGHDVYIIDWGYPTKEDMYLSLEDYILDYISNSVDAVLAYTKSPKLNIVGVCQGGTFSMIYTALNPEKVNALATMVAPVDFDTDDALLFRWSRYLDIDKIVEAYGVVPGNFMNQGFLTLKPVSLMFSKYLNLIEELDKPDAIKNFMRMENWIFDSPGQAGVALKQFINDFYKENKLAKGKFVIGGKKVNLKNITMPVLNIYAEKDHIVPPSASKPLAKLVGSSDVETHGIKTGHIGMYVSSKASNEVYPIMSKWLKEKSK